MIQVAKLETVGSASRRTESENTGTAGDEILTSYYHLSPIIIYYHYYNKMWIPDKSESTCL